MSVRHANQIIIFFFLAALPLCNVMAESFPDKLLRIAGISATPDKLRGEPGIVIKGNLWLVTLDESGDNEPQQITGDGTYHSPLWIPGSDKILAIKADKLIQLDIEGGKEQTLHVFSDLTILVGFDKHDANSILILQNSEPAVFSMASGQITLLPYDIKNSADRGALDRLRSSVINYRDYGDIKVLVSSKPIFVAGGHEEINKIHIKDGKQDIEMPCSEKCVQPALSWDRKQLVFVDN